MDMNLEEFVKVWVPLSLTLIIVIVVLSFVQHIVAQTMVIDGIGVGKFNNVNSKAVPASVTCIIL
jgi:uncharacterized membrane protein